MVDGSRFYLKREGTLVVGLGSQQGARGGVPKEISGRRGAHVRLGPLSFGGIPHVKMTNC